MVESSHIVEWSAIQMTDRMPDYHVNTLQVADASLDRTSSVPSLSFV